MESDVDDNDLGEIDATVPYFITLPFWYVKDCKGILFSLNFVIRHTIMTKYRVAYCFVAAISMNAIRFSIYEYFIIDDPQENLRQE